MSFLSVLDLEIAKIIIAKNRYGQVGECTLNFDSKSLWFSE